MLEFFRKKAALIGMGIVIFFGATMFTGSFFTGAFSGGNNSKASEEVRVSDFASLGNIPIDQNRFVQYANQYLSSIAPSPDMIIDPLVKEQILFQAFIQAARHTALINKAEKANIVLSKEMKKTSIDSILKNQNLSSEKELKQKLKDLNIDYKEYIKQVDEDNIAALMINAIQENVSLTNRDVDNKFSQIKFDVIQLINNEQNEFLSTEDRATTIYSEILKGTSFEKLKETNSDVAFNEQDRWVNYGALGRKVDAIVFELEKGEVSKPIKNPEGYFLIKLLDKQFLPRSKTFNYDDERKKMIEEERSRALEQFHEDFMVEHPLNISFPVLEAFYQKSIGNVEKAVGAYQKQISQNPMDPMPNYMLARLYALTNQKELAKRQYKWAELKMSDLKTLKFPFITIGLIEFYMLEDPSKIEVLKKQAVAHSEGNMQALKKFDRLLPELNDPKLTQTIKKMIAEIDQKQSSLVD